MPLCDLANPVYLIGTTSLNLSKTPSHHVTQCYPALNHAASFQNLAQFARKRVIQAFLVVTTAVVFAANRLAALGLQIKNSPDYSINTYITKIFFTLAIHLRFNMK